jgi:hypothetical protein
MLTGLAAASSHLLSTGETWSITGAIFFTLSCLGLRFGQRPAERTTALGRSKAAQVAAVLSPLLNVRWSRDDDYRRRLTRLAIPGFGVSVSLRPASSHRVECRSRRSRGPRGAAGQVVAHRPGPGNQAGHWWKEGVSHGCGRIFRACWADVDAGCRFLSPAAGAGWLRVGRS